VLPTLRGEAEAVDPVTRFTSRPEGQVLELATTKTSPNPKIGLMIAAAGVSLSKHTMHRTHDPEIETFDDVGASVPGFWPAAPSLSGRFRRRRSPWEPRLYGRPFGVSNPKITNLRIVRKTLKTPTKSIVLLCLTGLSGINM